MTEIAYPFVVARNRTLDWRALVAPEELITSNEDYGLVLQTGDEHPAPVTVRRWNDHSARSWVLCYRSVPADPEFVGEGGTGQLKDKFGRNLYLVEGVALRGSGVPSTAQATELVEQVHGEAVSAFKSFWSEVDEAALPTASTPVAAPQAPARQEPAPRPVEDVRPPVPWWLALLRGRGAVLAGGALAVVAALAWLAIRAVAAGAGGG
jgi:hypothetical protein